MTDISPYSYYLNHLFKTPIFVGSSAGSPIYQSLSKLKAYFPEQEGLKAVFIE